MIFTAADLPGVMLIDLDLRGDERGHFARTWCQREFQAHGLPAHFVQCSLSFSRRRGTLRGLHYQAVPHAEDKLIRCTHGSIWDVVVDLRPESPSFMRHLSIELRADTGRALFVPVGCAHGFQTLQDATQVFYQMTEFYFPEAGRGIRWNDPAFGIRWPIHPPILHPRDAAYPDFHPLA